MNKSINQIRVELSKIVTGDNPVANVKTGHLQLYSFFWGDFLRAYKENTLNYPLMGAFYPNGSLLRNQTQIPLTIYIADKLYKDWSNLNDIESDTLQICRDVFNIINHSTRWNQIGRVQSCSVTKFINRGGDEVAGHEMTIQFLIRDSSSICGLPMVDYDFDQVVGDGCSPVQIYENGVLVDTVASGGIYEYSHGDAHYVITNSVGGILYSGYIAENDTLTQAITDSIAVLKDTAGTVISSNNILAQASEDITAPDATYLVQYVNGTLIQSGSIVSGGSVIVDVPNVVVCANANWELRDSAGTLLQSGTVASGGTVVITAPNTTVNVNAVLKGTVVAGSTLEVNTNIAPTSSTLVGNVLDLVFPPSATIPSGATLMKTGQTTSYRTGDDGDLEAGRATSFSVLAINNPFGNTNRFTDTLGGQVYTNNIVIDWSTYNGSTVLGWDRNERVNRTWNQAIDEALAFSVGGFLTGWRIPNVTEMQSRLNYSLSSVLNYVPFSYAAVVNIWTATTSPANTLNAFVLGNTGNGNIVVFGKTNLCYAFYCRTFTVTGTTLS